MTNTNRVHLHGQRFGLLVALEPAQNDSNGKTRWLCRCDCGGRHVAATNNLRTGGVRSCGCLVAAANRSNGIRRRDPEASLRNVARRAENRAALPQERSCAGPREIPAKGAVCS